MNTRGELDTKSAAGRLLRSVGLPLWAVMMLAGLLTTGCAPANHSRDRWELVFANYSDRLTVMTTSAEELFGLFPRYKIRHIRGFRSNKVCNGYRDPVSGRIATWERVLFIIKKDVVCVVEVGEAGLIVREVCQLPDWRLNLTLYFREQLA